MKRFLIFLAVIFACSCASMSEEECLNADWYIIGLEDGSKGYALDNIGEHRQACAKVNVKPNFAKYEQGHLKGLERYCTLENGFRVGVGGNSYNSVCPESTKGSFLTGYNEGKARYSARKAVKKASKALDKELEALHAVEEDLKFHELEIISEGLNAEERLEHLQAIKDLQSEKKDIQSSIAYWEDELTIREVALSDLLDRQRRLGYE